MAASMHTGPELESKTICHKSAELSDQAKFLDDSGKVIYTKYSKHCPYTVAHTLKCVCSKINHGLNHGLFISLLKLILCPIH